MTDRKATFICPGAQKSGTTTLYSLLLQHPQIYLNPKKELYFFDNNQNYKKGIDWYSSLFADAPQKSVIGDITPDYMLFPECADRIYKYNPNVKLLFILRNPVDRAYSHYQMKKRDTEENKTFSDAIKKEGARIKKSYRSMMKYSYINRGYYFKQLKPYYDKFSENQIKVVVFEEFIKNISINMIEIEKFLGLTPFGNYTEPMRTNEGYLPRRRWIAFIKRHFVRPIREIYNRLIPQKFRSKIREMSDVGKLAKEEIGLEMRELLLQEFLEDILEVEKLTGLDLSGWKTL